MMTYLEAGKEILNELNKRGFEAYFVGGFVRDILISRPYNDIDIATNATPDDIMKIFKDINTKGIQYNSIVLKYKEYIFEVTTFRKDLAYEDHRHPICEVASTIEEDLERRDFTINAMAYSLDEKLIDPFQGVLDIENKLIKTVGDPLIRFEEDALRMLRACYFAAKLDFKLSKEVFHVITIKAPLIQKVSGQRVLIELNKIIALENSLIGFKYICETNLISFLDGLSKGIRYLVDNQVLIQDEMLFYSFCFYLNGNISEQYMFGRTSVNKMKLILDLAAVTENGDFNKLLLYTYGQQIALYANAINHILGLNPDLRAKIVKDYEQLPIKRTCDLKFKGQDIMQLTKKEAASWIGEIVDKIKYEVIMNGLENDYETIKEYVLKNLL